MKSWGPQPDGTYRSFAHHRQCMERTLVGGYDFKNCRSWARWWGASGYRCDIHKAEGSIPVRYYG